MARTRRSFGSFLAASLVLALGAPFTARAEDAVGPAAPKAGPPPPRPAIAHPYLDSIVGSWDVTGEAGGQKLAGHSKISKVLGGTAIVEQLSMDPFHGFGVGYVSADGKTIRSWWFDTMGQGGVWESSGALSADGYELNSDVGGKASRNTMKRTATGHEFRMTQDGVEQVRLAYAKAAQDFDWTVCPASAPQLDPDDQSLLGDWTVESAFKMGGKEERNTGHATFRRIVGGHYLLEEYVMKSPTHEMYGLGVMSHPPGGKTGRHWWFHNSFDGPMVMKVEQTDATTWTGKVETSPFGPFSATWKKIGDGYLMEMKNPDAGVEGSEKYTRKK